MARDGNSNPSNDGRCGYPAATTGKPCQRRPDADHHRCVMHRHLPGAPPGASSEAMQGNANAVTHGAYRRADLVLLDTTDEELEVFARAIAEDPTELMIGALFVEYRRFLERTRGNETARTEGLFVFAEQARKLAEGRAKIRAADKGQPPPGGPNAPTSPEGVRKVLERLVARASA